MDVYSRWKNWVQEGDNSKYPHAFTSVAGDPISQTTNIAPYIFLNTSDGWRIRPYEANYELSIGGNLYSVDPSLPMFVPTTGSHTVPVFIERSAAAIAVVDGGVQQSTVAAALTSQGFTNARAARLDNVDVPTSSRAAQQTMDIVTTGSVVDILDVLSGCTYGFVRVASERPSGFYKGLQALVVSSVSGSTVRSIGTHTYWGAGTGSIDIYALPYQPIPGDKVYVLPSFRVTVKGIR